jgi:hypothetical protein
MNIINKIRISYFRSFSEPVTIEEINDLNILSGKNDSGKSNILKALHLFFTENKIDFYNFLDFTYDFSKSRAETAKNQQIKKTIEIAILFNRLDFSDAILPEQFWVEKVWDKDGYLSSRKTKTALRRVLKHKNPEVESTAKVESSTTSFLKRIQYFHIPAIKDSTFLQHLKKQYQVSLSETIFNAAQANVPVGNTLFSIWKQNASVKSITDLLTEKINDNASELMESFKKSAAELTDAKFDIPNLDYSKVLEVITENNIPLNHRGDGIQAKLIPLLLDEICKNNGAKHVIWGFEEPENSYEYANAQQLAEDFMKKYAKKYQIFITSHAFNFITLEGDNVSKYRIYRDDKDENSGTKVKCLSTNDLFDGSDESETLQKELGVFLLHQELEKVYQEKQKELDTITTLRNKFENNNKPVLIVEDERREIYFAAWLTLNNHTFNEKNIETIFQEHSHFEILNANGCRGLSQVFSSPTISAWKDRQTIGLFDFDKEGCDQFKGVKKNWKPSDMESPPSGSKKGGWFISHPQHSNITCMLLPVPERLNNFADLKLDHSYVEIENLLPDDFLKNAKFVDEKTIAGGSTIYSIQNNKKGDFWKQLVGQDKSIFNDFAPLFETMDVGRNK